MYIHMSVAATCICTYVPLRYNITITSMCMYIRAYLPVHAHACNIVHKMYLHVFSLAHPCNIAHNRQCSYVLVQEYLLCVHIRT